MGLMDILSLANLSSHRLPVPPVYAKARIVLILLRCAVRDTCNPSFFPFSVDYKDYHIRVVFLPNYGNCTSRPRIH